MKVSEIRDIENLPLITIITVVYNAVSKIEETILSVINQTYENIEYIIIDGGSTDGTKELIYKYNDRITYWISENDDGIYHAMNKGVLKATGNWINFMNAGDRYTNENVLVDIFKKNTFSKEISVLYGNSILEKSNKAQIRLIANKPVTQMWKGPVFRHGAMFTKTYLHKQYPFKLDHKYKICADFDFIYLLYKKEFIMRYVDVDVLIFDEDGVSANQFNNLKYNRMILLSYQHSPLQNFSNLFDMIKYYIYFTLKKVLNNIIVI